MLIGGFAAILCWWIGMTGYAIVGGPASGGTGMIVFLAIPALASAGTYFIARRGKRAGAEDRLAVPRHEVHGMTRQARHRACHPSTAPARSSNRTPRSASVFAHRSTLDVPLVLFAFAAALFWWIGLIGYVAVGGVASGAAGFDLFLGIPAVATAGTYLAARRRRGPTSSR